MRTDRLQREYEVELRWTLFPLHPEIPQEGMELADLFPGREAQLSDMHARLSRRALAEGLPPLGQRTRTYNSRLAQELGKWAEAQGLGDSYRHAVYQAFFVAGVNIGLENELLRLAESVGLPVDEAREVLSKRSFSAAVDADWLRARELGITAVPTHLCGGKRLEGFAPYEDFIRLTGKDALPRHI